ncbi:pyridoxamine 5'-phosphate oxidase family protein [Betaproteobacteria bacterium]|nr:pyridoxamine 5'-phosphate oxidase family protein [Betaproteobacteria bacterium]
MSRLYGKGQRTFQERFGTRKLADRIEDIAVRDEFDDESSAFIESRDFFFLSTIDENNRPTVSYKGGDIGLVKILDKKTAIFPSYNGNGMFLSIGNLLNNAEIGLLFMCFEKPHRIRVQCKAELLDEEKFKNFFPGSELVVKCTLHELWQNCPRYIHRYKRISQSRYTPDAEGSSPLAEWKRIDLLEDVLPQNDKEKVRDAGKIGINDWLEKVKSGASDA